MGDQGGSVPAESGNAEEVVVGMRIGGQVRMGVHFSLASHVGYFSVLDRFRSDDAVLGLLHFQFCLVVLSLCESPFLDGSELLFSLGEEPKLAGEDLIRREE